MAPAPVPLAPPALPRCPESAPLAECMHEYLDYLLRSTRARDRQRLVRVMRELLPAFD
jgi:hypothetical protein